jgi:hypothetical protein
MEDLNSEQAVPSQINFVREGVKIGLINGTIALLLMYGSYFVGLGSFVTTQFISTFIPYMIIMLIIYGLSLRRRNGGYLSFKDGLRFTFMSYVIATLLVAIGTYILFNLVDKNLTQKSFELGIEKTRKFMENMGAKPEDIDKQMESFGTVPKETNLKNVILGAGTDLIWNFVKSLLITLIIRKEKPVF